MYMADKKTSGRISLGLKQFPQPADGSNPAAVADKPIHALAIRTRTRVISSLCADERATSGKDPQT